jgi:hypothetical protein
MRSALARINALPSSSWLGVVDSARSDAIKQLTPLTHTVESIDVAADSLPTLLGAHGAKHYMVTFENEAELRGTGGLPGAFAIVEADNGRLSFTQFEPDSTLDDVKSGLDFGPDFAQTYDAPDVTGDYRDANVSPNFPYAARIWLAEWKAKSGQTLDGAITMDPTALSYLLRVTGPAVLPDNTKVNANNVVQLTQQAVYAKFARDENSQRKQYLLDIARAVSQRLIATHGNTTALVRAAGRAASERRLLVWVTDPAIEARLAATTIGGAVPVTPAPYAAVTINNAGGNKIDYYLHAAVTWAASGCGQARRVTVTITLTNDAPADLPALVLGFTGRPGFPQSPGDNALVVSFYGTAGGALDGVLLNNDQSTASSGRELGHPVYAVHLPIGRGTTQTITFDLTEPGTGVPALRLQPMVNPMTGAATAASCN